MFLDTRNFRVSYWQHTISIMYSYIDVQEKKNGIMTIFVNWKNINTVFENYQWNILLGLHNCS